MKRLLTILIIASLGGWLSSCTSYYGGSTAYDSDDVYGNSAAQPEGYAASNEKRTETDEEFEKYLSEGEYAPEEDGDYYDPDYSDSLKSSGNGGDTYYINEYNDYSYANRIRRFNNPYYGYYDPFYSGWNVSVGYSPFWYGPNRWNYYAGYSPWSWYGAGSPYWGYGAYYNRSPWWYNGYGMYGNYWNGYNNGYYNGYYAGAYGYPYGYNYNGWGSGGYYYGNSTGDMAGNNNSSSHFGPRGSVSTSTSTGGSSYDDNNTAATYSGLAAPPPEIKIGKPQSVPVYSGQEAEGTSLVNNSLSTHSDGNLTPNKVVRSPHLINTKPKPTVARSPWGKKPDRYTQPTIEHNRSPYEENNWNRAPSRNNNYNNRTPSNNNFNNRTPSNNFNNGRTPSNNYNNRTPSRNNNYNSTPSRNNNINRTPSRNNNSISSPSRGSKSVGKTRSSSSSSGSRSKSSSTSKRKR